MVNVEDTENPTMSTRGREDGRSICVYAFKEKPAIKALT